MFVRKFRLEEYPHLLTGRESDRDKKFQCINQAVIVRVKYIEHIAELVITESVVVIDERCTLEDGYHFVCVETPTFSKQVVRRP